MYSGDIKNQIRLRSHFYKIYATIIQITPPPACTPKFTPLLSKLSHHSRVPLNLRHYYRNYPTARVHPLVYSPPLIMHHYQWSYLPKAFCPRYTEYTAAAQFPSRILFFDIIEICTLSALVRRLSVSTPHCSALGRLRERNRMDNHPRGLLSI